MEHDPEKVVREIENYQRIIRDALNKGQDFQQTHEDIIRFLKALRLSKEMYKTIDIKYPEPITVKIDLGNLPESLVAVSAEEANNGKRELAKEILNILEEQFDIFSKQENLQLEKNTRFDALELKPNICGIGLNFNYILKIVPKWLRKYKK
ncbi:MAG: hypothetical protein P9M00_01185 [Candidatus Tritonobacter lacicola]|nr:hypothetical protein [Candidatus Tritonobacter lacicola]